MYVPLFCTTGRTSIFLLTILHIIIIIIIIIMNSFALLSWPRVGFVVVRMDPLRFMSK